MPNCTGQQMLFGRLGRREIEANFSGGAISSDGGLMLVRQTDRKIGLSRAAAAVLSDPRDPERIPYVFSASPQRQTAPIAGSRMNSGGDGGT